jgi:hypothetical protein
MNLILSNNKDLCTEEQKVLCKKLSQLQTQRKYIFTQAHFNRRGIQFVFNALWSEQLKVQVEIIIKESWPQFFPKA